MYIRPFCLFLLLLICCLPAVAQKETNIWLLGKNAILDFNYQPPRLITDREVAAGGGQVPAMADKNGKLLFYSDGIDVYTRNGTVMPNGASIAKPAIQSIILVPKPKSPFEYYVVTTEADNLFQALRYSLVDMRLNGGLGDVTTKGVSLGAYVNGSTSIAAVGNCDNSVFWIIAQKHVPSEFYSFRIDERGVSSTPVVSSFVDGGIISQDFKVSPNGDKIVWGQNRTGLMVGNFNLETGQITDKINYPQIPFGNTEFSSNGKLLYIISGQSPGPQQLVQVNLAAGSPEQILQSKVVIHEGTDRFWRMQLGADGRIYIRHADERANVDYLTTIEPPNLTGIGSRYNPTRITIGPGYNSFFMPEFVTSLLREHGPSGIPVRAGPDAAVCQGQPLRLGDPAADPSLTYRWSPAAHLSDPSSPSPTFTYAEAVTDSVKVLTYALTVSRGNCVNTDTVRVKVYPLPTASLTGTRSVCPRVEGVEYRVEEPPPGHTYRWKVSGGTLTEGQGTASIRVNWGPTNPEAWVEAVTVSPRGCQGPAVRLPVRINVELIPETPRGPEAVCLNQRQGVTYIVTHTPGSVYTWFLEGGTLASGQGSSRVTVDWVGEGRHRIWLQEQSTVRDTICFGVSEPLGVTVYQDRTRLELAYVSVSLEQEGAVEAHWGSTDPTRLTGPLTLLRRRQGESNWQQAASLPRGSTSHADPGLRTNEQVYQYRVETRNGCDELIGTTAHATVLLTGEGQEEDGRITLTWSGYEGWEQGVERYEIWRKLDGEEQLRPVGQVSGSTLSYGGASGLDGFAHRFRVKAISRSTGLVSWSNELALEFRHELTVPNVFTPNGDGYNETFLIRLLELYPDNELNVYSRWGQPVYRAEGYRNGWTGEGLAAGTYYYSLLLRRTGKLLKGWVEVVR
jgi:gliding motility-associated-like protein